MAEGSRKMDDRSILMELYSATKGSSWKNSYGWDTDSNLSRWHGVTVNGAGRVVELELADNGLEGSIPESLGELSDLTFLNLKSNRLSGPISKAIGNLHKLTMLNLYNNKLGGKIPTSLGALSNLEHLNLRNNKLTGAIPQSFSQLSNLVYLKLDGNELIGAIPEYLGQISSLRQIMLGNNMLSGTIPKSLGRLSNLDFLNLTGNQLIGTVPQPLGRKFHLTVNPSKGKHPTDREVLLDLFWATNGPSWKEGAVWNVDSSISDWHGVKVNSAGRVIELELMSYGLEGAIPESLGKLSCLTHINLWGNQLIGSIPKSLGQLSELRYLNLEKNTLTGAIPESLGQLSNLTHLNLWRNRLNGRIPESLGRLSKLVLLNLRENELSGPIPEELGQLANLVHLYLYGNKLSGDIPKALGQLGNLTHLSLRFNRLVGISKEVAMALERISTKGRLSLEDNPWGEPPAEVVSRGLDSVVAYWDDLASSGAIVSWKLKVVLVGAVKAGKTSLVKGMMKGNPDPCQEDERTKGVDVHVSKPCKPDSARSLELIFWDFAGHSEYFSTHQIFLSKGALHILVVDLKRFSEEPSVRDELVDMWLDVLQCRVPGSHVLIIATQIDRFTDDYEEELANLKRKVKACLDQKRSELETARVSAGDSASSHLPPSLDFLGVEAVSSTNKESLLNLRSKISAQVYRNLDLFPSVGKRLPVSWVQVSAMLEAKRSGNHVIRACRLEAIQDRGGLSTTPTGTDTPNAGLKFIYRANARDEWSRVVRTLQPGKAVWPILWDRVARASKQSGNDEKNVFDEALEQLVHEGAILDSSEVLYLEPTWINNLLRAILDHDLRDSSKDIFWKKSLVEFSKNDTEVYKNLQRIHDNFVSTGIFTVSYLRFLWREVPEVKDERLFKSLLRIMSHNGLIFEGVPSGTDLRYAGNAIGESSKLFLPLLLPSTKSSRDLATEYRFQKELVCEIRQKHFPPGVLGLLMARLLSEGVVKFDECWNRGVVFSLDEVPVMLHLNESTNDSEDARITVKVFGENRSSELQTTVHSVGKKVESLFHDRFPGIYVSQRGETRDVNGSDPLINRIDRLEEHIDTMMSRVIEGLGKVEANLKDLTKHSLKILARVNELHLGEMPFPSLVIIRPAAAQVAWGKRSLKARMKDLVKSVTKLACTDMRVCFLCPYDFSEVPCGLKGNGYPLSVTRDVIKKIYPVLQVTAVVVKVAIKAAGGVDLPVSEFINGAKAYLAEELADYALNKDDDAIEGALKCSGRNAEKGMELVGEGYEKLKNFMGKHKDKGKKDDYVRFDDLMRQVDDGQGGKIWVSNRNAKKWKSSRPSA